MDLKNIVIYFLTGGIVTTLIVVLEESSLRLWSGLAALVPIFTLVSYIFIGNSKGDLAVSEHAKFVLVGTLLSWIPYMLTVIYLSPIIGSSKSIAAGIAVFLICVSVFLYIVNKYNLFT